MRPRGAASGTRRPPRSCLRWPGGERPGGQLRHGSNRSLRSAAGGCSFAWTRATSCAAGQGRTGMPTELRLHAAPATLVSLAVILALAVVAVMALSGAEAASNQLSCGDHITT